MQWHLQNEKLENEQQPFYLRCDLLRHVDVGSNWQTKRKTPCKANKQSKSVERIAPDCCSLALQRTATSHTNIILKAYFSSWQTFLCGSQTHFIPVFASQQQRETHRTASQVIPERNVFFCVCVLEWFCIAKCFMVRQGSDGANCTEGKKKIQTLSLTLTANHCVTYEVQFY